MYRHTHAVEKLTKIQADFDKQLLANMKQIKDLAADRDLMVKQVNDLEAAAQAVVEMVEENGPGDRTLVECLCGAPQRISNFLSDTFRQYLGHALGLVKSFWPVGNLALIGDGMADGYSEEKFSKYVEEMKPVANKVIIAMEQPSSGEA